MSKLLWEDSWTIKYLFERWSLESDSKNHDFILAYFTSESLCLPRHKFTVLIFTMNLMHNGINLLHESITLQSDPSTLELSYFKDVTKKGKQTVINLTKFIGIRPNAKVGHKENVFAIETEDRKYILRAPDQLTKNIWLAKLCELCGQGEYFVGNSTLTHQVMFVRKWFHLPCGGVGYGLVYFDSGHYIMLCAYNNHPCTICGGKTTLMLSFMTRCVISLGNCVCLSHQSF